MYIDILELGGGVKGGLECMAFFQIGGVDGFFFLAIKRTRAHYQAALPGKLETDTQLLLLFPSCLNKSVLLLADFLFFT